MKLLSSPLLGLICGHVSQLQIAISSTESYLPALLPAFSGFRHLLEDPFWAAFWVISLCFPSGTRHEANQDAEIQQEKMVTYKRFMIASGTQRWTRLM